LLPDLFAPESIRKLQYPIRTLAPGRESCESTVMLISHRSWYGTVSNKDKRYDMPKFNVHSKAGSSSLV